MLASSVNLKRDAGRGNLLIASAMRGDAGKDQDARWVQERLQQVAEDQRQLKADLAEHALLLAAASTRLQDLQQGADQGRAAALEAKGQAERLTFLQTMVRYCQWAGHHCDHCSSSNVVQLDPH